MAKPSRRVRRQANLRCDTCQRQFRGFAWFVSIGSFDMGTLTWNVDRDPTRDAKCPHCGSKLIRYIGD
jgi:hypothetical protein